MIKTENVSRIVNNGTNNGTEEFVDTGNSSTWEVVLGNLFLNMIRIRNLSRFLISGDYTIEVDRC